MKYDMVSIGNRLKAARERKNIIQSQLCKDIGINQSTYSKIENGKYNPPLLLFLSLCEYLDVSILWLLGKENDKNNEFTDSEYLEIEKYKRFIKFDRKN